MNNSNRNVVAHALIGAAILVGSYLTVVDRNQQQLSAVRVQTASLEGKVREAEALRDLIPSMTGALDATEKETAAIKASSTPVADERALYASLMSIAASHQVRLEEVNPAAPQPLMLGPKTSAETLKSARSIEHSIGYSIVATATYTNAAAFLRAIETDLGFSIVRSVRLSPLPESGMIRLMLNTEHYAFDVVPRVAAVTEEGGAAR